MRRTWYHSIVAVALIALIAEVSWAQEKPTPGFNNKIPESILTPDTVETKLGTLKFFDGIPDDFKEQDSVFDELRTYTMPRVYNLLNDPQERDNVLFPNTWVTKAALVQLEEHVASLKRHPPVPTGAPDPYQPTK